MAGKNTDGAGRMRVAFGALAGQERGRNAFRPREKK